jgi:hypothetical protein
MKNKNGFDLGPGECPGDCNDGIACDWLGDWRDCWVYQKYYREASE